ncbi:phage terminase large subunit family protein, partial [Mesorhizobium sp. M00.F.Ca.ET.186.01.1.1]
NEPGGWYVYERCDREYAEQITAEHKIEIKRNGKTIDVWQLKTSGADNHYLDTEVYAAFAADRLGIRYLTYQEPEKEETPAPHQQEKRPANNWVGGDKWL